MSTQTNSNPSAGATPFGPDDDASQLERDVWSNLDGIPDPHLPVSLVELAMVYDVEVDRDEGGAAVTVEVTFPCMGCPAYDMILDDIRACLVTMSDVESVDVEVVWEPVWSKDMLGEEVRQTLTDSGIGL